MSSPKHTEVSGEQLSSLAQLGAERAEFRTFPDVYAAGPRAGKPHARAGESYATYSVGGPVEVSLPDGRVGIGRAMVTVNLTRVGTRAELDARRAAMTASTDPEAFRLALEATGMEADEVAAVLATLARRK